MMRLILHSKAAPVHVLERADWWERARRLTAAISGRTTADALSLGYFREISRGSSWQPRSAHAIGDLAAALSAAMDAEIHRRLADAVREPTGVDVAAASNMLTVLGAPRPFWEAMTTGWWEPEHLRGELRCGPDVVPAVARIVGAVIALSRAGYSVAPSVASPLLASIENLELRALALPAYSEADGAGGWRPAPIAKHARKILADPTVVLVACGDCDTLYRAASQPSIASAGTSPGLEKPRSPALLLGVDTILHAAECGEQILREYVEEQRSRIDAGCCAALDEAKKRWSEQDAA